MTAHTIVLFQTVMNEPDGTACVEIKPLLDGTFSLRFTMSVEECDDYVVSNEVICSSQEAAKFLQDAITHLLRLTPVGGLMG